MSAPAAEPFALALFYPPTRAGARAAGVQLPSYGHTLEVSASVAISLGLMIPQSGADSDPESGSLSVEQPPTIPPLPSLLYRSNSKIHPKNFDQAQAFLRIQPYNPSMGALPTVPSDTTSAVLLPSALGRARLESLPKRTITMASGSQLEATLEGYEGPCHISIDELASLEDAGRIASLLQAKVDDGWECTPPVSVFNILANSASKLSEVEKHHLPKLLKSSSHPDGHKSVARAIRHGLRMARKNANKVQPLAADLGEVSSTVGRLAKPGNKIRSSVRKEEVAQLRQQIRTELRRAVVFVGY